MSYRDISWVRICNVTIFDMPAYKIRRPANCNGDHIKINAVVADFSAWKSLQESTENETT